MIPDRQCVWEQLDGPQATALFKAVWEYWRNEVEFYQGWYQLLQVEIIPSGWLDVIGNIMDFPRPVLLGQAPPPGNFVFSNSPPAEGYDAGYDSLVLREDGALVPSGFAGYLDGNSTEMLEMSDHAYRAVLRVLCRAEAEVGSLGFWSQVLQEIVPGLVYRFIWGMGSHKDDLLIEVEGQTDFLTILGLRKLAEQIAEPQVTIQLVGRIG
jgi:hypothetical protein